MSTPPKPSTDGTRDFHTCLDGGLEHLASDEDEEQLIKTDKTRDSCGKTGITSTLARKNGNDTVSLSVRVGEHTNENEDYRQLKVRFPKKVRFVSEEPDIWQKEALSEEIDQQAGKGNLQMEKTGRIVQYYEANKDEQGALPRRKDPLSERNDLERVATQHIYQSFRPSGNERGKAKPQKADSLAEKAALDSGKKRGPTQIGVHHCVLAGHLFARVILPEREEKTRNKVEERHVKCERCRWKIMKTESFVCEIAFCRITACSKCAGKWERERREKAKGSRAFDC